jgi:Lipocalin-like domain
MARFAVLLVACLLCVGRTAMADDASALHGVWVLKSFKIQIVGEDQEKDVWGPNPKGYLILLPTGRMMTLLTAPDRKPATNDAESAALLKSMNAYTGRYTVDGNKWTTTVDLSHNEVYVGHPQVRHFKIEGNKLIVKVPEQPSAIYPGKRVTASLEWIRER